MSKYRYHETARTATTPRWYQKNPAIDTSILTKTFLGIVRDSRDPQNMGRVLVWIPEITGEADLPENWVICSYCSPFAGASFFDIGFYNGEAVDDLKERASHRTPEKIQGQFSGRQSYGMWFVPPDIGNEVLVTFVNGDPNFGVWFGCLFQQDMNFMVPGLAAQTIFDSNGEIGPVIETDLSVDISNTNEANQPRKVYSPLRNGLRLEQGLDQDSIRGQSSSSAKRESPSEVFGILSPDGNHFVIDDSQDNEYIRLRTKSGTQLLINQTSGMIYAISRDGKTWLELSNEGNIDIYGSANVSVHAEKGNINLKTSGAESDINIQAERDINIKAGRSIKTIVGEDYNLKTVGDIRIQTDAKTNILSRDDIAIKSEANIGVTAFGQYFEKADNIYMNTFTGPQPDNAIAPRAWDSVVGPATPPPQDEPWEAGDFYSEGTNIVPRVPQHEPWPEHQISTQGTTGYVVEGERPSDVRLGSVTPEQTTPNNIANGSSGKFFEGSGYTANNQPEYIEVGEIDPNDLQSTSNRQISEQGIDLIKEFEGASNCIYQDVAQMDTIGVGHLITVEEKASGRFSDGCISDSEVNELLLEDLERTQRAVRGCVTQPVTQEQYDALVSMAFNIGSAAFCDSTLVRRINDGRYEDVPNEMLRWNKARVGNVVQPVPGLTRRRVAEAKLFAQTPSLSS